MRVRSAGRVPTNIVRCGHRGAVWVALGLCACGIAERAAAQALTTPETYYVSTMQRLQPGTASPLLASGNRYLTSTSLHYVQPFTTGSRRGGYGVNEVRVALAQERGYVAEMHIVGTEDQSGRPTSSATTTSATFPSISADAPLLTADAGLAQYFFKFEGDLGTGRRYVPRDTVLGIVLLQGTGEGSNDDTVTWSTHVGEPAVAFGWGLHNHHWARNTDDSGWDQVSGEEVDLNIGYPTAPVFDGNMTVGTRTVGGTVNRGFEGEGSNTFGSLALADATLGASFVYGTDVHGAGSVDERVLEWSNNRVEALRVNDSGVRLKISWGDSDEMDGQTDLVLEFGGAPLALDEALRTTDGLALVYVWDQDYLDRHAPLLNADHYASRLPAAGVRRVCLRTPEQRCPATLISNVDVGTAEPEPADASARAVAFTTGANPSGYGLTGAKVAFGGSGTHNQRASSAVLVRIFSATAGGKPDIELGRLIGPGRISSGLNTFAAPPNTVLDPGTRYALVITGSPRDEDTLVSIPTLISRTSATSTDPHSQPGWRLPSSARYDDSDDWGPTSNLPVFSLHGTVRKPETVTELWSATMNIGATATGTLDGFCDGPCFQGPDDDIGSLEDDSGFGGKPWSVESIRYDTTVDPERLMFTVKDTGNPATFRSTTSGLRLKVGIADYALNAPAFIQPGSGSRASKWTYVWETATSTMTLPVERRPWNDAAISVDITNTAVVKLLIRRSASGAVETLSALTIESAGGEAIDLDMAFDPATTSYDAMVSARRITVDYTLSSTAAGYAVVMFYDADGAAIPDADGTAAGHQIDLELGLNVIEVAVFVDGVRETYTLRVSAGLAPGALLRALTVTDALDDPVTLRPSFAPAIGAYRVLETTGPLTVVATPRDGAATLEYLDGDGSVLADADPDSDGFQLSAALGTVLRIAVTSPDGKSTTYYEVSVTGFLPVEATVYGADVVLDYGAALDAASVPGAAAYAVRVDDRATLTPSAVAVAGTEVTLTLPVPVGPGRVATLSYVVPAVGAVRGVGGPGPSEALVDWPLANARDDVDPIYLSTYEEDLGLGDAASSTAAPRHADGLFRRVGFPFSTGPRAHGYLAGVTVAQNRLDWVELLEETPGFAALATTTATSTPGAVDIATYLVAPQNGRGDLRFTAQWLPPGASYAFVLPSETYVGYRVYADTQPVPLAAPGWNIAPRVVTSESFAGGSGGESWESRGVGDNYGGTGQIRIEGDREPLFVNDVIVGARGDWRGYGANYGSYVQPGTTDDAGVLAYGYGGGGGSPVNSWTLDQLAVDATGVLLEVDWLHGFSPEAPTDLVLEFAGAGLALDDAAKVGDHGGGVLERSYRWEQSWLDVNAPWLNAVGYAGTLPENRRVPVCLRTYERSCPAPAAVAATLDALSLADADGNAVDLDMMFAPGTTSYTATVSGTVHSITVTPMTGAGYGAVLFYDEDGAPIPDADADADGYQIAIGPGVNTIRVAVFVDGAQTIYTLRVTRQSDDAALSALTVTDGLDDPVTLRPSFAPAIGAYRVLETTGPLTVVATPRDGAATLEYLDGDGSVLADADPDSDGFQLSAALGTVLRIAVTSPDGKSTTYYAVAVTGFLPVEATVYGADVVLDYGAALDAASVPGAAAYAVRVDDRATLTPSAVAVAGTEVTLTLPVPVGPGRVATLSYVVPAVGAVRGVDGPESAAFVDWPLANARDVDPIYASTYPEDLGLSAAAASSSLTSNAPEYGEDRFRRVGFPFSTGPRAHGYLASVTVAQTNPNWAEGQEDAGFAALATTTATSTPGAAVDIDTDTVAPQSGRGDIRFKARWLAPAASYAFVVPSHTYVGYRHYHTTQPVPLAAPGWNIAPRVVTSESFASGGGGEDWESRGVGDDYGGTGQIRIEGDREPVFVNDLIVGARGAWRGYGADYGGYVQSGTTDDIEGAFAYGDNNNGWVRLERLAVDATGVLLEAVWLADFSAEAPTDLVLEFAGAGLALDDAAKVGDHGGGVLERSYRWEQSWLDVNAPWLNAVGYAGTLPENRRVPVCLRTYERSCPAPAAVAATLDALSLADADGNAVDLDMMFAPGTTSYTATVSGTVHSITVTPMTGAGYGAVLFYDGDGAAIPDADADADGYQIAIGPGVNTIRVAVFVDGAQTIYTLRVTRQSDLPVEATVYGADVVLDYGVALDEASVPGAVAYTVRVDDRATLTPSAVAVAGTEVTLTLPVPVGPGRVATLTYVEPAVGAVQGGDSQEPAEAFVDWPLANARDDVDPVYLSTYDEDLGLGDAASSTRAPPHDENDLFRRVGFPFSTGPRAHGYLAGVTVAQTHPDWMVGTESPGGFVSATTTGTSTPGDVVDITTKVVADGVAHGVGDLRFEAEWLPPGASYAFVVPSDTFVAYRVYEETQPVPLAAPGWNIAPRVVTSESFASGGGGEDWESRGVGDDYGGTGQIRIEGDPEPLFVNDVIVGARGAWRGYGADYGSYVQPGTTDDAGALGYGYGGGGATNSWTLDQLAVDATGVLLKVDWLHGFSAEAPTDLVLEFAGAGLALDDAAKVGDHGGTASDRSYRWEQSWLDVNAPWLNAAGYAGTLPENRRVPVCLRTYEQSCPAPAAVAATLDALSLADADGNAVDLMFAAGTTSYAATVSGAVHSITVTPTIGAGYGTVLFYDGDGAAIPDADADADGYQIALAEGDNVIVIEVFVDGVRQTYTVTVNRQERLVSRVELEDPDGDDVPLTPAFGTTTAYRVWVRADVAAVTVSATTNPDIVTYQILDAGDTVLADADGMAAGFQVALAPGDTVFKVLGAGANADLAEIYTFTVTRIVCAAPNDWCALMSAGYRESGTTQVYGFTAGARGALGPDVFEYDGADFNVAELIWRATATANTLTLTAGNADSCVDEECWLPPGSVLDLDGERFVLDLAARTTTVGAYEWDLDALGVSLDWTENQGVRVALAISPAWTATMTVADAGSGFSTLASPEQGAVDDAFFDYGRPPESIEVLVIAAHSGGVQFRTRQTLPDTALVLEFAAETLPLADAAVTVGGHVYTWDQAWLDANAPALNAANAAATLPTGSLRSVCLRLATQTTCPNAAPTFAEDPATRAFAETAGADTVAVPTDVGLPVVADDPDRDAVTYSLVGTDAALFAIDSSGQIRTVAGVGYDYEARSSYAVTVVADDGNGGTASVDVTLELEDLTEEPPPPPAPRVLSFGYSSTSLDVEWEAPDNAGRPDITGYDLRYKLTVGGADWPGTQRPVSAEDVARMGTVIERLAEETGYDVQVRAVNDDGDSDWSLSGSGSTAATSTDPLLTGCDGSIWCATVTVGHHNDGANDHYGYVAPGVGDIDRTPEFTYDGLAYTVTVAGRRAGGGADDYIIGIAPAPPFDFLLGAGGLRLQSTAASTDTATTTDGMSADVYAWPRGTGPAWGVGRKVDVVLRETAATIASATTTVTITAENAYAVLHGDFGDALEYRLERTATDGDLSVWVDLSSRSPEFVAAGDRRKKVDFADGESTATLRIPAWQLTGIPELGEVVEGGAVVARLAEGSSYAVGTPGAAEERVVVWVAGFDARSYEVDERDGKVAVSLTARYVGGGLPAPAFNSRHGLSVSSAALGDVEAMSPEDYAAVGIVIEFPEYSTDPDPDNGFSDVDGDGTYEMTRTFDQGIVWDAEDEGGLDPERFLLLLEIIPGLASLTQFAWPDGRRCAAVATSNPDHPDNCLAVVAIDDSPRTAIENVSIISAPAAAPDTYGAGERIMAAVRFAADVTVVVSSATSTATATMQVGTKDVKLPYKYQKSADTVVFGPYEVQPGDMDDNGVDLHRGIHPLIRIIENKPSFQIVADGIAIRDGNGDEVFPYLQLPNAGVFAQHKVDGSLEPPPVLVSNTGLGHFRLATDGASAQGFHTGGSGEAGEIVTVHSVGILVEGCSACPADPAQARVRVYRAGPNAYTPAGEPLFALTAPASVATSTVARFTAPEDAVLRADADYHLVFDDADGGTFPWALPVTNGDAEDAHSQPGWTIEDVRGSRLAEGSVWTSRTFVAIFDIRGATSTVANIPATGKPRILGGAREGVPMTVDTSAIADGNGMAAAEFEYSWSATTTRGVFDPVAGATADTYTPDAADVGKHIAVGVAFTDDVGYPESSISDFTPPVASSTRPNLEPTGTPTILGRTMPRVGDTLTADASAVMDEDGLIGVVFAYEWIDADAPPGGDPLGTGPQYHLQPGDEDRTIMLRVKYVDNLGLPNTIDSVAAMAVAAQPADGCRPDRIQLTPDGDIGYCHDNEYRYVCGDSWDIDDANVACRQAGYRSANSFTKDGTGLSTAFWLDEVECTGAEATLGLCAHDGWGVHDCGSTDLAGVGCEAAGSKTLSALSLTDADGNKVVLSSVWEDAFDPVVADYTARVASSTTVAVVVAATSTDPAATVTIGGTAATTTTVAFEDGDVLPITVRATATDGATMDYRITVARGDAPLQAVPSVTIANATSTEGSLVEFTVTLSATSTSEVSVDYAVSVASGDTATGGADFATSTGKRTIVAGLTTGTIWVGTENDSTDEHDERFTVSLLPATTGAELGSPSTAKGTILDNDPAPRATASTDSVDEGAAGATTTLAVVFELAQVSGKVVTFDYATEDGTAEAGQDYTSAMGTARFLPGERRVEISIEILGDAEQEGPESFVVKASNAVNVTIPTSLRNGVSQTIDDDDGPPPPPPPPPRASFAAASYTVTEDGATATVQVQLDRAAGSRVDIPLTPVNQGGATNGDYSGVPSSLSFGGSQTSRTFTVRALDDSDDDDGESVLIRFGALPSPVVAGSRTETTVHLLDNDGLSVSFGKTFHKTREGGEPATVRVLLNGAPSSPVTIRLTWENRNGATDADHSGVPESVTFAVSETVRTFAVTAVRDNDVDDGEEVKIGFGPLPSNVGAGSPSTTSVALEDDLSVSFGAASYTAVEGGAAATVTVRLSRSWGAPFTLPLTEKWHGGASTGDYSGIPAGVTFRGDETTQSFTVTALDDALDDDGESVEIGFGWPRPQAVWTGEPSTATVNLVDDDSAQPQGALRLAQAGGVYGGSYGRLQVYHADRWGLVCDLNFDELDAKVACVQLGFADGEEGYAGAGSGGLPFWLKGLDCDGTESRLVECPHRGLREHSCGSFHIVGVECSDTPLSVADARVSGALLTLGYAAALDAGSVPAPRDYVVFAGASAVAVESVAVAGDAVVLTLARPVLADETVRLSYLVAPMHPVQDARGTAAAPLTDRAVRNTTPTAAADRVAVLDVVVSLGETPLPAPDLAPLPAPPRPALDLSPLLADAGASAPLGRLDLSSRTVADLSALAALAGLTELRVLRLDDNRVVDVGPLAALTGLRVLDLSSNAIADVGPLAALTGLERLDLSDNRIADLSALSALTGLEVLLLDGNRVADVVPLWSLQRLVHLGLAGNRIADVALVAELASLQRLDLSRNAVSDVSPLGDLAKLVWLRLPGNPIADAAPLGRLTLLRWLWLDAESDARGLLDADARRAAAPLWVGRVAAPEPAAAR